MSDNHPKLGELPPESAARDAIHMAVCPGVLTGSAYPGSPVSVLADGQFLPNGNHPVGIVDPFLNRSRHQLVAGSRVWILLNPGSITSLRHEWTHPAFSDSPMLPDSKAESKRWIETFANECDCPGYEALMEKAEAFCDGTDVGWSEEYLHWDGEDAHGNIPPEFWTHFFVLTAKKPGGEVPSGFSCSC